MKKIIVNGKEYYINCEDNMCGKCNYIPLSSGLKCKLLDVMLDHLLSGYSDNSGWKRCSKCKEAEI